MGRFVDPGAENVLRKHEQRLANAVPALELASTPVYSEFGIFVWKDGWLGGPESVGGLKTVHGVSRAEFSGLHNECNQTRGECEQKHRTVEPVAKEGGHRAARPFRSDPMSLDRFGTGTFLGYRVRLMLRHREMECLILLASHVENFQHGSPHQCGPWRPPQ